MGCVMDIFIFLAMFWFIMYWIISLHNAIEFFFFALIYFALIRHEQKRLTITLGCKMFFMLNAALKRHGDERLFLKCMFQIILLRLIVFDFYQS